MGRVTFALSPSLEETLARKILLADDSVTAQNMGRKILADAGYEVITVNNGSAALKKIAELKPDLIILDVYMPGYSGLEVCQRLKDAQETSRVPVLLTVGKLEPFKPEEAKRVRADGFIVKPFEASELLSSLSKLEDKIVPRAETSKPGRFARVTASIEEARYDRTVAADEDNGWKNRISFPPKKKEQAASEEDDAAAVGARDRKSAEKPQLLKKEETRVDLGALAPEGLPKDVTPEEIAALAAAAAQVKGKILDSGSAQSPEFKSEREFQPEIPALPQEFAAAPMTAISEPKYEDNVAAKAEEKRGYKFEAESKPAESEQEASKEKIEEKNDHTAETIQARSNETQPLITGAAEAVTAGAGSNQDAVASSGATLGDEFSARGAGLAENQAVTMALAGTNAGEKHSGTASRWQAVSLTLAPEDTAISLELEMQKAYAAFAAANNPPALEAPAIAASTMQQSSTENSAVTESSAAAEPSLSEAHTISATTPDAAQPSSSTEAIRAAVQELEMVAEPYTDGASSPTQAESALSSVSAPEVTPEAVASEIPAPAPIEPPTGSANFDSPRPEEPVAEAQQPKTEDWKHENPADETARTEDRKNEDTNRPKDDLRDQDHRNDDRLITAVAATPLEMTEPPQEAAASNLVNHSSNEQSSNEQSPISAAPSDVTATAGERTEEGRGEATKKESDEATNPAAAWASWRRIRESDSPNSNADATTHQEQASTPKEAAAMAVAAGAEKAPDEAPAESDPADIANIVDSVLADLRPKIFEEISRKMGKKK